MKIQDVIDVEKELLFYYDRFKFGLTLDELIKLNKYVKDTGEITSLYFEILCQYAKKCEDPKFLEDYKKDMDECDINGNINLDEIKSFVVRLNEKYSPTKRASEN